MGDFWLGTFVYFGILLLGQEHFRKSLRPAITIVLTMMWLYSWFQVLTCTSLVGIQWVELEMRGEFRVGWVILHHEQIAKQGHTKMSDQTCGKLILSWDWYYVRLRYTRYHYGAISVHSGDASVFAKEQINEGMLLNVVFPVTTKKNKAFTDEEDSGMSWLN